MSKLTKLALILVIAGITMAATQLMPVKDEAATARAAPPALHLAGGDHAFRRSDNRDQGQ
jgi:hypothetical protein